MKDIHDNFAIFGFVTLTLVETIGILVISSLEIPWFAVVAVVMLNALSNLTMALFDQPRNAIDFVSAKIPFKAKISDTVLIFVCSPDDG